MIPRGIRLNNPGNIRKARTPWQGLAIEQNDRDFATFKAPVWGIRAIARTLITYQDQHGCETTTDFIRRWAPAIENDTVSYVSDVCRRGGITRDQQLNAHKYEDLRPLVVGIVWHENGQCPYSHAVIDEALKLAGVVPDAPTMARDPKVIAATVVTTATAAQQVVANLSDVWDGLGKFGINPHYLMIGLGLAVATVGVWFALDWWKRRGI